MEIGRDSGGDPDSKLGQELNAIADKCIEFGTPDLYCKFLFEIGDDAKYLLVKKLLSCYFRYLEQEKNCCDPRALAFLTTITNDKELPDNVKILSWNYDSQLEIAASKLKHISQKDGFLRKFQSWPNTQNRDNTQPFLLHLNEVAGFNYSKSLLCEIENRYNLSSASTTIPLISFAWETKENDDKYTFHNFRMKTAIEMISQTEILVIIGYSFPFFNRKVDKEILARLIGQNAKIFFQDPFTNGDQLINQFGINPSQIHHVKYVDNYFIPYEL